jgi:HD-like signal output (HDOD) protein
VTSPSAAPADPRAVDAARDGSVDPAVPPVHVPAEIDALVADLQRLPAARPALLRVVQIADHPDCSVRSLAEAAAVDPAFTARLLHLANSACYGRSRPVTAIGPAVSVLGAETLRALAVTMALGLAGEHGPLPEGFWDRAAATASGSSLVAPATGADPGDALCVGLLLEVGQALLFRACPEAYGALLSRCDAAGLAAAERAWCGTTSGAVAAAALGAAGLPPSICAAIAQHQDDDEQGSAPRSPLGRALRGGALLARAAAAGEVDGSTTAELVALSGGALDERAAGVLVLRTASQAAALRGAMA